MQHALPLPQPTIAALALLPKWIPTPDEEHRGIRLIKNEMLSSLENKVSIFQILTWPFN